VTDARAFMVDFVAVLAMTRQLTSVVVTRAALPGLSEVRF
jgi:hypothetical protein